MRRMASLLVIATACDHGRVVVHPSDVASRVADLNEKGRAEVPAMKQRFSSDWSTTTTTIHDNQRVDVNLSSVEIRENERFTGLVTQTFGELVADCPRTAFATDTEMRQAHPRCKLLSAGNDSITVGTTTYPGPILWGALGASIGLGIVACAEYCDSPFSEVSTGAVIVGGVVAVVGIVGIAALISKSR